MKKLINDVADIVPEALLGYVRATEGLRLIDGRTIVVRADLEQVIAAGQVAIVSGGGSGHEPAHAGYVGQGMLTAAVAGDVFASPSTDAVLEAIRTVAGPGGVLLIVKNYTGDRLNFGLAAQIARGEGIATEMVIVDDDCALGSAAQTAGRRGIAGTVLVHKIAGAAAAAGLPLAEVAATARAAIQAVGSMGVALTPCTVPAAGTPNFNLGPQEIELGLGIHGEAGSERVALRPARDLAQAMIGKIAADRALPQGAPVALLVNNLGATPPMELSIMANDALEACAALGLRVERVICGTLLTAIDMAGVSLSLMQLDDARRQALDAETSAPAWVRATVPPQAPTRPCLAPPPTGTDSRADPAEGANSRATPAEGPNGALPVVLACCAALIEAEPILTRMDQIVGDGDIGRSLASGAAQITAASGTLSALSGGDFWREVGAIVRRSTGGTSGPLYAILATAAGNALDDALDDARTGAGATAPATAPATALATAFGAGVQALQDLGGAAPGDRTMVDALAPAAAAMIGADDLPAALAAAATAARRGAEATRQMPPRRGRSSYIGDRVIGHVDPGAEAVAIWLGAARDAL
ncbi:dihydroxyacetone kinase subunit DhaK [Pseudooceanicola sediminis]|uniref:Dihydroxyacetone kinase subunit DhaK n=1 Tax=Pseudooceanicola sediminis TaxID=2211117 RepID=A0A399J1H7_9RHOB|nr:dihydroxyacetone kinase family protein [Pseudooceanicola sediminis]KAA2316344.1 dihydroxyacetone kinase subunit DhaK [Puniceibacterium sp. HSS470]RII39258.1 dihydroxyacetone kinase subunit DhaK [Pseudooceanicola sediminis]|tara:strand:+ start:10526 stop:12283 length:1758 start_codon:yes stop_codon:yes gene_type:complete